MECRMLVSTVRNPNVRAGDSTDSIAQTGTHGVGRRWHILAADTGMRIAQDADVHVLFGCRRQHGIHMIQSRSSLPAVIHIALVATEMNEQQLRICGVCLDIFRHGLAQADLSGALGQLETAVVKVAVSEGGRRAGGVLNVPNRFDTGPDRRLALSGRNRKSVFQEGHGFTIFPELRDMRTVASAPERGDGRHDLDLAAVAVQEPSQRFQGPVKVSFLSET